MAAQQGVTRRSLDLPGSASRALFAARNRSSAAGADAAGSRFWPTLVLVALCQLADLITFNFAVATFGPSGELGPLGAVYRFGGFWAVAVVKLGLIGIVMAVLARYPWRKLATRRRMALIVAGIGAFGALTNALAFVWLT
jgi:hypothetical protein